jgi:hypothetical protein
VQEFIYVLKQSTSVPELTFHETTLDKHVIVRKFYTVFHKYFSR